MDWTRAGAAIGAAANRRRGLDADAELPEAERVVDASLVVIRVAAGPTDVVVREFGALHFCSQKSLLQVS